MLYIEQFRGIQWSNGEYLTKRGKVGEELKASLSYCPTLHKAHYCAFKPPVLSLQFLSGLTTVYLGCILSFKEAPHILFKNQKLLRTKYLELEMWCKAPLQVLVFFFFPFWTSFASWPLLSFCPFIHQNLITIFTFEFWWWACRERMRISCLEV